VLAVVVALVLAVAACSSDDEGGDAAAEPDVAASSDRSPVSAADLGPFDLAPDGMSGPGTPLGAGLEVPEGAVLLGVAFPDLVGSGFRALLLVTGDPVAVFNAVADQAGGLGMVAEGGCLGTEGEVACSGRYVDEADGERLRVNLDRTIGPSGVVSGMGLQYEPPGTLDPDDSPGGGFPTPTDPVAPVPLPEGPIAAPDDIDVVVAVREPDGRGRSVEVGSELVGLPGPCACAGTGWSFVVELTGVERDVLAAYARQFSDLGDPPDLTDTLRDTYTILGVRVGTEAPLAEVRAVVPDAGPAYAIVTYVDG
jgi:hypothetical protein